MGSVIENYDSALANSDLIPTTQSERTWTWYNYFATWMGMVHNIFNYAVAAGLLVMGMNAWQALITILIGNLILLGVIILNGELGVRYGTPFPVLARASFGVFGANVPALIRAIVAIGWFGIQSYLGSQAFSVMLGDIFPGWAHLSFVVPVVGLPINELIAVLLYWVLFGFVVLHGMETIKRFESWAGPLVLILMLGLVIWAVHVAHGFGPLFSQPSHFHGSWALMVGLSIGVATVISSFSTLGLNIPDFTRFARSRKDHIVGQLFGLPITQFVFALMAVIITSGSLAAYHQAIWNPVQLIVKFHNPVVVFVGSLILMVATLSINVAANLVSPAYDLSNVFPRMINFRRGALITLVVSFLMMPWRLLVNSGTIDTILGATGAAIAPATAIMIVDFWLVKKRNYSSEELYLRNGKYGYSGGWNWRALVSLVIGFILAGIGLVDNKFAGLYKESWFVGMISAGIVYWILESLATHWTVEETPQIQLEVN